jgi:hypothetical protein
VKPEELPKLLCRYYDALASVLSTAIKTEVARLAYRINRRDVGVNIVLNAFTRHYLESVRGRSSEESAVEMSYRSSIAASLVRYCSGVFA